MDSPHTATTALTGVVAVVLVDYLHQYKAWGWTRLVRGAGIFRDVPGLQFAKVMGSGHEGGFSLRPSTTHQGLVCMLASAQQGQDFLDSVFVREARERARESWTGLLAVTSVRGQWDGQAWGPTSSVALGTYSGDASLQAAPLAVLTRASIRPTKVAAFWRHAPTSQKAMEDAPGCSLAVGLGEAPVLRQCTFSLWRDTSSMEAYARGGAHGAAAQAAHRQDYFSESMFVRLKLLAASGQWKTLLSDAPQAQAAVHV